MSGLASDDVVIGAKHDPALAEAIPEKHENDTGSDLTEDDYPTQEELKTLRRVPDKVPWKAFPIAFVELCERFSYYGTTVVCEWHYVTIVRSKAYNHNFLQSPISFNNRFLQDQGLVPARMDSLVLSILGNGSLLVWVHVSVILNIN